MPRIANFNAVKIGPAAQSVITSLFILTEARRVTRFLGPDMTIKATRQRKHDGRAKAVTLILTVGPPNFAERKLIKQAQKRKQAMPVVRVQDWPRKRA